MELIIRQKRAVAEQIAELNQTLKTLEFKEWYYKTAKAAGTTELPRNMKPEELPEELRKVRLRLRGGE